jgi:hypothetical protein
MALLGSTANIDRGRIVRVFGEPHFFGTELGHALRQSHARVGSDQAREVACLRFSADTDEVIE